jgi:hypothetical protein
MSTRGDRKRGEARAEMPSEHPPRPTHAQKAESPLNCPLSCDRVVGVHLELSNCHPRIERRLGLGIFLGEIRHLPQLAILNPHSVASLAPVEFDRRRVLIAVPLQRARAPGALLHPVGVVTNLGTGSHPVIEVAERLRPCLVEGMQFILVEPDPAHDGQVSTVRPPYERDDISRTQSGQKRITLILRPDLAGGLSRTEFCRHSRRNKHRSGCGPSYCPTLVRTKG